MRSSRLAALALGVLFAGSVLAADADTARDRAADFDTMWRAIDQGYAYRDGGERAWERTRAAWRPRAVQAQTRRDFVFALEQALATLGDDHVSLSRHTPEAPRAIPGETDIWARWQGGAATVTAVRTYSDADVAGLRPGDVVVRVQGEDVEAAVRSRAGEAADPERRDRALRALLAGPRFGTLRLEVRDARGTRRLAIARAAPPAPNPTPLLVRRMGEHRDLGYMRLRDMAAGAPVLRELDAAITHLRGTRGLILDLRESKGPARRADTASILARFARAGTPWQLRESRAHGRIEDRVPEGHRSPPYDAPILVLTDRWTEGEAEALAAGLHEAAHARIVGTPGAGLRGDLREATLPHSGIVVRFPAERTLLLDGTPRERLQPEIPVDLAHPSGGPGDPILYQALKVFEPAGPAAR